jgi:glycine cleavage system H lipoate-binding protein
MQTMIEILQTVGVFFGGVLARFGLFLAVLAVLVLPALAAALIMRAVAEQRRSALGIRRVAGLLFRPDLFYAPGHTWLHRRGERRWSRTRLHRPPRGPQEMSAAPPRVRISSAWGAQRLAETRPRLTGASEPEWPPVQAAGALEVGIDDLAQRLLPSVTAVELPHPGARIARGGTIATLHGGGRPVRIPSPVAGTVAGVNAAVVRDPALVKRDGYGKGWLVAITPADRSFGDLPRGAAAETWLERESARWSRFVEDRLGLAAADGGELIAPAPWLVGEKGWSELTAAFLDG